MKKLLLPIILVFSIQISGQIEDRFGYLLEQDLKNFSKPLATSIGVGFNSGGYNSAYVPKLFGFSIGLRGMLVLIPNDQLSFTPEGLPDYYSSDKETATIYGGSGSSYTGPLGYLTYPAGIDRNQVPLVYPQAAVSVFGTELMVRYLPDLQVGEETIKLLGVGVKHSISQYIPLIPISISVQYMYNTLSVTNIMDVKNSAINAHVSRSFGLLTLYGGVQYEKTSVDFEYTYEDPNGIAPELENTNIKLSLEGENRMRFTMGGSLNLAFLILNADYSLGVQNVLTTGVSFEF